MQIPGILIMIYTWREGIFRKLAFGYPSNRNKGIQHHANSVKREGETDTEDVFIVSSSAVISVIKFFLI